MFRNKSYEELKRVWDEMNSLGNKIYHDKHVSEIAKKVTIETMTRVKNIH